MNKIKKKIRKKYSDFYTAEDIFEEKSPQLNFSITDLDKKGHLSNPKAPCVVTSIDPQYTKDANRQQNFYKFNVKSDILRLRDITRKKFQYYITQQRALEKAQEDSYQSRVYEETKKFLSVTSNQLDVFQNDAFCKVLVENEKLKKIKSQNVFDEFKESTLMHQKLSTDVRDVHKRFIFLLKLIGYFDVSEEGINILKLNRLADAGDYVFLKSDLHSDCISAEQIKQLKQFVVDVIDPYLKKQTFLNADVWIDGYENTRRKLFEYYNQFTKLAILNHIVSIVHYKFLKFHQNCNLKIIAQDPSYLKEHKSRLQDEANQFFNKFEQKQIKSSKICWDIKGVAPVLLEQIQQNDKEEKKGPPISALTQLEKIHNILMSLLNELDSLEPDFCKNYEEEVRRQVTREKKASRNVLIKVNRFQNWIEHYKKHQKK
ncbi:uncharacterized protein LOC129921431 [Episyrphus balteatus]|uniref:uncharacterized protein LOC129921431 n=1 Tax=Episyrphus balteatus TaxID=286459 RepID=UPI002485027E|nr:uncharacterized protein LOC129921431 [Episyrphus balteatus]